MTQALKLVDKYPPLSLLEGYVEKAKWTALELFSKNVSDKSLVCISTRKQLHSNLFVLANIIR